MAAKRKLQQSSELEVQSEGVSSEETTKKLFRSVKKRRAKDIQVSGSTMEKSIDQLHKEIVECQKRTKALELEINNLLGLKDNLKGINSC